MKVSIQFDTDNAAFEDGSPEMEINYILHGIGKCLLLGIHEGPCQDTNGNTVGRWSWE